MTGSFSETECSNDDPIPPSQVKDKTKNQIQSSTHHPTTVGVIKTYNKQTPTGSKTTEAISPFGDNKEPQNVHKINDVDEFSNSSSLLLSPDVDEDYEDYDDEDDDDYEDYDDDDDEDEEARNAKVPKAKRKRFPEQHYSSKTIAGSTRSANLEKAPTSSSLYSNRESSQQQKNPTTSDDADFIDEHEDDLIEEAAPRPKRQLSTTAVSKSQSQIPKRTSEMAQNLREQARKSITLFLENNMDGMAALFIQPYKEEDDQDPPANLFRGISFILFGRIKSSLDK
jgi:hypothetical protein